MAISKQASIISNFTFPHIPSVQRRDNLLSEPKEAQNKEFQERLIFRWYFPCLVMRGEV